MDKLNQLRQKPVYIYMLERPRATGSGSQIRLFTTLRAYLDLGFDVEAIRFVTDHVTDVDFPVDVLNARFTEIDFETLRSSIKQRIAFRLGWPFEAVLSTFYPWLPQLDREVSRREQQTPGAIHHFEYLATASVIINRPIFNSIFSSNDIEYLRNIRITNLRREFGANPRRWNRRLRVRYLKRAQQAVTAQSRLVLTVATHETDFMRDQWKLDNVELFPMSCPNEMQVPRSRSWVANGQLRLLHLGRIDSIQTFRSLEFLLKEVFPLLESKVLNSIHLSVVGKITDNSRTQRILDLASLYPQVGFLGFQDEIRDAYASADLQVVGSKDTTGLRTRIIESFAYGLPVLSTHTGAEGIVGLQSGENILLEEDPEAFARTLTTLLYQPNLLSEIAAGGRRLYDKHYSRQVASERLGQLLSQYLR